jgi:hypothetical protein
MLVDDTDDANSRSLEYLALKTMREGFHGRVAASHCGAMARYNDVYAAKAARVEDYGIAEGSRADLVVVGAPSVHEAIRLQPLRRHVIKEGREVARSTVSHELLKS